MISIDFNKYKRFFAFGCSFTNHIYPTWADVISVEMPNAQYYNLGKSGGGNLFISVSIAEANRRFNFTETDLIMVMYSTFYREDRWFNNRWQLGGNVYNNGLYDDAFVKKYADPTGYVIRDLGLIEMSMRFIKSLPCESYCMMATGWDSERIQDDSGDDIEQKALELYKDTLSQFPPSLLDLEFNGHWSPQVSYFNNNKGELMDDPHPRTIRYRNYLQKIGMPLTELSKKYVDEVEQKLVHCKTAKDFENTFVREFRVKDFSGPLMF